MNSSRDAKRILCYGDSNTWGYVPGSGKRHPVGVRWTSLLQQKLGNDFEIIEEGLNGRTTDLEDTTHPGRSGLQYLRPCLETHDPINLVILMLGTNDLKERFNRPAARIADGVEMLIGAIEQFSVEEETKKPQIILISPPLVDETVPGVVEKYLGAGEKSTLLSYLYEGVAKKLGCLFVDAAEIVSPSKVDGYHLEPVDHQKLADSLYLLVSKTAL